MRKLAIGMLPVMAAIAAAGFVTVPTMTNAALAATASTGSLATDHFAVASSSASSKGPSGSSSGTIAICPSFVTIDGTCSESAPK